MTKSTGKPRGRPPGIKYDAAILLKVTSAQRAGLYDHAKRKGKSASAVIRELIGKAINDQQAKSEG